MAAFASITAPLVLTACSAPNPAYCEDNSGCKNGTVCSADHRCVMAIDAPMVTDDGGATIDAPLGATDAPPSTVDAPPDGCAGGFTCLPSVSGWIGPVAVGDGTSCPGAYPTSTDEIFAGISAAPATCDCGCLVDNVGCNLFAYNPLQGIQSEVLFEPDETCESPPIEDACLFVETESSCKATDSSNVPPVAWDTTAQVCGGQAGDGTCNGGACMPEATGFGRLCIVQDGDTDCPAGTPYTEKTSYFRGVNDSRGCTACDCTPTGQACQMQLEVCSVGFFDVTLHSNTGDEQCLQSGDGDGITLQGQTVTSTGSCSTSGGAPTGSAAPTDPVTVCCAP